MSGHQRLYIINSAYGGLWLVRSCSGIEVTSPDQPVSTTTAITNAAGAEVYRFGERSADGTRAE